ncbi:hypothetical protein KUCAC02_033060 [Chaenocephalus aceratus]|nr:hypothetical protein KUCAC02_033060 [Chaenocephalus aceratus]
MVDAVELALKLVDGKIPNAFPWAELLYCPIEKVQEYLNRMNAYTSDTSVCRSVSREAQRYGWRSQIKTEWANVAETISGGDTTAKGVKDISSNVKVAFFQTPHLHQHAEESKCAHPEVTPQVSPQVSPRVSPQPPCPSPRKSLLLPSIKTSSPDESKDESCAGFGEKEHGLNYIVTSRIRSDFTLGSRTSRFSC